MAVVLGDLLFAFANTIRLRFIHAHTPEHKQVRLQHMYMSSLIADTCPAYHLQRIQDLFNLVQ